MDGGAGLAIALREWVSLDDPLIPNPFNRKPRQLSPRHGIAFGVKRPESSSLERFIRAHDPKEFQYVEGYMEDHNFEALGLVGTADFVTSPFGAFTYTTDPVAVIEAYMKLLKVGGSLFLFIPDKNFEFAGDFYKQANKDEPPFVAWLKEAYGNENVASEFTIFDDGLGFRVEIKKPTVTNPLRKLETKKFIQHPAAMPHRTYAPVTK
jgi:SAM-dependent methyltransferase